MKRQLIVSLILGLCASASQADAELQTFVTTTLAAARDKAKLPAVATLVQINGKIEAQAAVGVREVDHPEAVTIDDRWHLGSDAKAMTATMISRLTERGILRLDETMAQLFPGIASAMNEKLHDVTLAQLLSHTSGLAPLSDDSELTEFLSVISGAKGVRAQRALVAVHYLSRPPASKVGEFSYSNLGFVIAGAAAEARTGHPWEELIESEVFKPLGMREVGFGPPGRRGKVDQPRGHVMKGGKWTAMLPGEDASDNPPAIGPAGTINISLHDWLLFAQDQLDGVHGHGKLLKAEGYKTLQTPISKYYALGWGVLRAADGSISVLTHTGSNGFWVSDARIYPKRDTIILTFTNAGGEDAEKAVRDIDKTLQQHLKALD